MDLSTVKKVSGIRAISTASFAALFRVTPATRACVWRSHSARSGGQVIIYAWHVVWRQTVDTPACPSLPEPARACLYRSIEFGDDAAPLELLRLWRVFLDVCECRSCRHASGCKSVGIVRTLIILDVTVVRPRARLRRKINKIQIVNYNRLPLYGERSQKCLRGTTGYLIFVKETQGSPIKDSQT